MRALPGGGTSLPEDGLASGERVGSVRPHPESQDPEVADGTQDDTRFRAGWRPRGPRVMRHSDLDDVAAARAKLDQQLCREERAAGLHGDPFERFPSEQLAGAVDVADLQSE